MKKRKDFKLVLQSVLTGILFFLPLSGIADDENGKGTLPVGAERSEKKPEAQTKRDIRTIGMPVYKPPLRGAPGGRVGGGTRAPGGASLFLSALVPDHTGLTVQEQPSLYWYLSGLTTDPIEFTLIEDQAIKPILETRITPPSQPGIRRVRLGDYGVRLKPGIEYKWFVAVVVDPENRSKDLLAGGVIERVEPPGEIRARLAQAGKELAPNIYAEAGIWYETMSAVSDMIDASPNESALHTQRASLLQQVGLPEVADYDKRYVRAD